MQQNCVASWQEQPPEVREALRRLALGADDACTRRARAARLHRCTKRFLTVFCSACGTQGAQRSSVTLCTCTYAAPRFLLHARDALGAEAEALLEGASHARAVRFSVLTVWAGLLEHGRLQLSQLLQRAAVRQSRVSRSCNARLTATAGFSARR